MYKERESRHLTDDALDIVNGGARPHVGDGEAKFSSGRIRIEAEGEEVFLINNGGKGFSCILSSSGRTVKQSRVGIAFATSVSACFFFI